MLRMSQWGPETCVFGAGAVLTLVVRAGVCADLLSKCWVYTLVVTMTTGIISKSFQYIYTFIIYIYIYRSIFFSYIKHTYHIIFISPPGPPDWWSTIWHGNIDGDKPRRLLMLRTKVTPRRIPLRASEGLIFPVGNDPVPKWQTCKYILKHTFKETCIYVKIWHTYCQPLFSWWLVLCGLLSLASPLSTNKFKLVDCVGGLGSNWYLQVTIPFIRGSQESKPPPLTTNLPFVDSSKWDCSEGIKHHAFSLSTNHWDDEWIWSSWAFPKHQNRQVHIRTYIINGKINAYIYIYIISTTYISIYIDFFTTEPERWRKLIPSKGKPKWHLAVSKGWWLDLKASESGPSTQNLKQPLLTTSRPPTNRGWKTENDGELLCLSWVHLQGTD